MDTNDRLTRGAFVADTEQVADEPEMASARRHEDQHAHYTHQMPEELVETSSRVLTRLVPLAYGALLGSLGENLALGFAAGLLLSGVLDFHMRERSLLRSAGRRLYLTGCPMMAMLVRGLAVAMRRLGLGVPACMRDMACEASHS